MIRLGVWVLVFCYLPVVLQALNGPDAGSHLGLGLLAIVGTVIGVPLMAFGVLLTMIRRRAYKTSTETSNT